VTRVDQTILASDPKREGNCLSACVATFLGRPLEEVPHFAEYEITAERAAQTTAAALTAGNHPVKVLIDFGDGVKTPAWIVGLTASGYDVVTEHGRGYYSGPFDLADGFAR
jgi:hypothetical protein